MAPIITFKAPALKLSVILTSKYHCTRLTGSKLQKAYTSLGSSCHNVYTRFQLLLAHAYAFLLLHDVRIECHDTHWVHHIRTEMHYAWANNNWNLIIWCTHCGRKDLNWCTPFRPYGQWDVGTVNHCDCRLSNIVLIGMALKALKINHLGSYTHYCTFDNIFCNLLFNNSGSGDKTNIPWSTITVIYCPYIWELFLHSKCSQM